MFLRASSIGSVLAVLLLPAVPCVAQDAPHLLATLDDLARAQAWAAQFPWARAARDQVVATARGWPQSHLNK